MTWERGTPSSAQAAPVPDQTAVLSGTMAPSPFGRPISTPVFYGLAIATVGGPLALVALFVPQTIATVRSSSDLVVLLGAVVFVFPVVAWWRYAGKVASSGGLYSFVEAAAGTKTARAHGALWVVSYFLYLPSTVAFVVYDILPVAFPGIVSYRWLIEIAIPVAMVLGLVTWRVGLFSLTAAMAAAQVVIVGVLAGVEIARRGAPATAFALHVPAGSAAKSVGLVSLFFVCGSLPLYLGAEVRRATTVTARGVVLGIGVGAVCAFVGAMSLGRFPEPYLSATVPGWLIGRSLGGRALGDVIVLGTALSILSLVLFEYVALTRLLPAMTLRVRPRQAELGVGAVFVAAAAASLAAPDAAYEKLLTPSLVALYLSQAVVFAVYPRFRQRQGKLNAMDLVVAAAALALMLYGLYMAIKTSSGI